MTHAARTYAAALLLIAAFAGLAALLLPNPGQAVTPAATITHTTTHPVHHAAGTAVSATLDLLATADPSGEPLTPAQAQAADETADRVCEGYVALVPARVMVATVAADSGLTLAQASAFVTAAHSTRCPNF